ncbi:MAG: RluA family pseudouridine synthase [Clostridiales bacterium]|nr:RluA family pseudouridine synthase [Clostridiales bacterium]
MIELNSEIIVEDIDDKQRLDVFLAAETGWTRSQIKLQVDSKRVLVNGKTQKAGFLVKNNDKISLSFAKDVLDINAEPEDIPLDIVYEDDDFAIINKPQGMVVHPAPGAYNHTLVNALLFHFDLLSKTGDNIRPGIVHRIDKDTSGLLVVAKNDNAHASLAKQIAEHSCFRHYMALLEGNLKEDSGTVDTFIARSKTDRKVMAVSTEGKRAITHYNVVKRFTNYCLVEFVLETGRTHQIRVHSKYLGHPIVGDKTYGIKNQKFNLEGQLLHAYKLELTHPTSGKRMSFECEIPEYFNSLLNKLK